MREQRSRPLFHETQKAGTSFRPSFLLTFPTVPIVMLASHAVRAVGPFTNASVDGHLCNRDQIDPVVDFCRRVHRKRIGIKLNFHTVTLSSLLIVSVEERIAAKLWYPDPSRSSGASSLLQ